MRWAYHGDASVIAKRINQHFGGRYRCGEPFGEAVERVQRDSGIRPDMRQAAAEHAALMIEAVEEGARSGQHGAGRGIQIFVERDVNRIEPRGIIGRRDAGIDRLDQQPCAIEMKADATLAREFADADQLADVERLAGHAAHRVSIEITPTGTATRASGGPTISAIASSSVKLARPGASGTKLKPLSCCAQSPSSLKRWLSRCTTTRRPFRAKSRKAR